MSLNNNDVAAIINEAAKQSLGLEDIAALDLSNVVDIGNNPDILKEKEKFTNGLFAVVIKNWFTDSKYRSMYKDPFFVDAERFGAIVQNISIEVPEVQASHAWNDFRPSEGTPATAGVYNLYLPVVHTQLYGKSVSWEIPVCITEEQWDVAFKNASEVRTFVDYIFLCVDNALVTHLQNMDAANRNMFIAQKAQYAASEGAQGIHLVNLVEEYQKSLATPADMTKDEYLNSVAGLQHGTETLKNYRGFMRRMSTTFNTAQRKRFTPDDRLVLQVLEKFENRLERVAYSDTYHEEFVKLPGHDSIPYFQGEGNLSFDDVSHVSVKVGENALGEDIVVDVPGVVAFMADKWACLHTIKNRDVVAQRFAPEHLTQYYNQFRDQYMNDLTMNAIVFVVQDYKVPDGSNESDESNAEGGE